MNNDINKLGVYELSCLYSEKKLSPVETVNALLREIEAGKELNAFISVTAESALDEAKKAEQRYSAGNALGPLDGVPYAVKDIFYTRNAKTTMASRVYKDFRPDYNAAVIDRLESQGAILIGKTNTHEFACNPMADVSFFGPCKNPHNPEHTACGSSGGSGAAVAAHMVPATLGSDTAGSVRIPAAACGVVGMRPTQGLVSRYGVFPLSYSIDNVGPLTRSVLDNAMMLEAMAGYDYRDERSIRAHHVPYSGLLSQRSLKGMRFAVPEDLGICRPVEPEIAACFEKVLDILMDLGALVERIPSLDPAGKYETACRTLRIGDAYVVHKEGMDRWGDIYTKEIYDQMQGGKNLSAAEYIEADRTRLEFQIRFTELMQGFDIFLTPTLPITAPLIGTRTVKVCGEEHSTTAMLTGITVLSSFTGYPSISIPCGFSSEGLPIGLMLGSARLDELRAYQAAYAIEKALALPR